MRLVVHIIVLLSLIILLTLPGCTGVHTREQRQIIENLKASEQHNGWYVIVAERGIFYLDLADSTLRPLYEGKNASRGFIGMASLNPTGNKIVFSESADLRLYSLVILDLAAHTRDSHFQLPYLQGPRWSRNGSYIAFEGTTTETNADSSLFLYKLGESDFSLLVKGDVKSGDLLLCWSPDNKRIVYESADNHIRIVDIETKQLITIDSGEFPTWSPNGKYISYQNQGEDYVIYDLDTGRKKQLLKGGSVRRSVIWSPDSRYIVYSKLSGGLAVDDTYGNICAMDVQSKVEVQLYRHSGSLYATDWGKVDFEARAVSTP
jgi:Tol biopolymer transport system component